MRKQFITLEYHTDLLAQFCQILALLADLLTIDLYSSALNRFQRIDTAQHGTFSTTTWSYYYNNLSSVNRQAHIVQNHITFKLFGQMFYFQ